MNIDAKNLREMSNVVRATALRMLYRAQSGHVGIVMGAADIVTMIYAVFLNPKVDRFVLSAGHGSALLYSVLKLAGYDIGDVDSFRRVDGLPGHPEFGLAGVSATTGPLGQGVANAVGMAIAAKHNETGGRVFCLCSDGDLMEGVAQEAVGFAGRYKLNNLILLWDDNGISIDGVAQTDVDVPMRMRAAGWTVKTVNGDNFDEIYDAVCSTSGGPLFIQCKTVLGYKTSVAGTSKAHGFGIDGLEFEKLIEKFDSKIGKDLWQKLANQNSGGGQKIKYPTIPNVNSFPETPDFISTRELSGLYLSHLAKKGARFIGGSADLSSSTNVRVDGMRDILPNNFSGNFINFGVREHAMAAIMNGLAYAGIRPFGSTFLVFSDYMRGAMRLSALSGLPVVYVLTHDSIAVGQDGPTHQPVEQIAGLRLISNMNVFRPCNMAEVAYAWQTALSEYNRPSCIILSRQKFIQIKGTVFGQINQGGYVIYKPKHGRIKMTLLATGAEVPLAVSVAKRFGGGVQVASIPSVSHFMAQDAKYKRAVLRGRVVAIEAGATAPWFALADAVVGVDGFGMSGPGNQVYKEYGFDPDAIFSAIRGKIKNGKL